MTFGELIELAAIVAVRAPLFVQRQNGLPPEALAQYWSASKCRQQRWSQALGQLARATHDEQTGPKRTGAGKQRLAADARPVLIEIFASEVLTRVWTAVVALDERRRKTGDAEPITRSVYLGHLEARRRALTLLVHGPNVDSEQALELNRWRRRTERWNDMLVGYLLATGEISEFAFDADLAAEFGRDFRGQHAWRGEGTAWPIVMASLQAGGRTAVPVDTPNRDLNGQIGAAVLACFPIDAFDSIGLPRSLWAARLLHTADSTRGLIDQLLGGQGLVASG
jgi:hypothetical protein